MEVYSFPRSALPAHHEEACRAARKRIPMPQARLLYQVVTNEKRLNGAAKVQSLTTAATFYYFHRVEIPLRQGRFTAGSGAPTIVFHTTSWSD